MNTSRYLSFLLVLASCIGGFTLPAHAATFVVTSANDSGTGTLRSALDLANSTSNVGGADIINFNIPGSGVQTINLQSALPAIQEAVTINGYSQPGSSVNTSATASNAVLRIEIRGSSQFSGLNIVAPNCTIKGLAINSVDSGISMFGSISTGNHIEGCFIGTNAAGTAIAANASEGIGIYDGAASNTIGGTSLAARNVISGNGYRGVIIASNGGTGPSNNVVAGNLIGTNAAATAAIPNGDFGVYVTEAPNNTIGGTANSANVISGNTQGGVRISGAASKTNKVQANTIGTNAAGTALGNGARGVLIDSGASSNSVNTGNRIAFNTGAGVAVYGSTSLANAIRSNFIYSNTGCGIKLMTDNQYDESLPTPNDTLDADVGPNHESNWPVITSYSGTTLSGVIDALPNTAYFVDVFGNSAADPSGFGEGQFYLGTASSVTTNAAGHATWTFTVPGGAGGDGKSFSATATTASGDTSEFGPAGVSGLVVNTNDSGIGSLRNAINIANQLPGTTIKFNIPTSDPGYAGGVFTIKPLTGLPRITADGTIVDGSSQKIFTPTANPVGPAVQLNGSSLAAQTYQSGLFINASNCVVRDLIVNGFIESAGIQIYGGEAGDLVATGNSVQGCYIGTDPTATQAVPNDNGVVLIQDTSKTGAGVTLSTIGGNVAAQRNIISGNIEYGVIIAGANATANTVTGNYIGSSRTGTTWISNSSTGIVIAGGARNNQVGGTTAAVSNLILGQPGIAIRDINTDNNTIQGNLIGTNITATQSLVTSGVGIHVGPGGLNNTIGGTATGAGNTIAAEDTGILIGETGVNTVQGNFIGCNSSGAALTCRIGVYLFSTPNALIGGTATGAANTIANCSQVGVFINGSTSTGNKVQGNRIGVAPNGTTALGNALGVQLDGGAHGNTIGGLTAGASNIIAANTDSGILIQGTGTSANLIQANTIGTNSAGAALGNARDGVLITAGATNNIIGASLTASAAELTSAGNRIANNTGDGVAVETTSTGNVIRANQIKSNGGLGINLRNAAGDAGSVTGNDTGDADTGANNLQNYPIIDNITVAAGKTTVKGTLNSSASTAFLLDLYDNSIAEPSGFGEAGTYVASQSVTTDSSGNASFTFTLNQVGYGGLFSLTATRVSNGDTSELGPQGAGLVVVNTKDSGPGSLRTVLTVAKSLGGTVRFNIPTTDSGFKNGVFTIQPLTPLPALNTNNITIDGATQTTFTGDTNLFGPEIFVDGAKVPDPTNGFELRASRCAIKNIGVTHFVTGIDIIGETATFNTVTGCFLGLAPDGVSAAGNQTGALIGYGAKDTTIGGISVALRNVISGNDNNGITVTDNDNGDMARNKIIGNTIGLNANGTSPVSNGEAGISLSYVATGTTIGGTTPGERNVISGNTGEGIGLIRTSGNRIVGNYIGTNAAGTEAIPNASGVIEYSGTNTIGGVATGEGNRIAFNRFYGISVEATADAPSHVTMRGNQIFSNGLIGINLFGGTENYYGGVTTNDDAAKDADTGPNGLQNYPVINGFAASGSQTTIKGTLTSVPSRQYILDFYRVTRPDDSGYGEGDTYLGNTSVNTNSSGVASFNFTGAFSGQYFSATATDALTGDTSEFSSASVTVQITSFTPKVGPAGTVVTMKGGSFVGTSSVEFGGVKATVFSSSADGTTLTATVPAGATTGPIRVTTPVGVAETEEDFVVTPPVNDNFANALILEPHGGILYAYNNGATKESGEPNHAAPGGASVWFKWQPEVSGRASIGISSSTFDTLLAVYTGTKLSDLVPVASNNDSGASNTSSVSFPITAGKKYFIAVDGVNGAQGKFTLQWTAATKAPDNDNFAKAQLIEGDDGQVDGTNLLATKETGEPAHAGKAGGTSVWYYWRPSQTGLASFTTETSTIDTLLAVYTGDTLSTLKLIASNDDSNGSSSRVDFNAVKGVTYKIAIDGFNGAQGDLVLINSLNLSSSTISWTGAGRDGKWSNPANWNLNRIPAPTDTVSISNAGLFTVTLDTRASIDGLILGDGDSNLSKAKLLIPANTSLTTNTGVINLGSTLLLWGGTFRNNYNLEMRGTFNWNGGTWAGTRTYVAAKAILDINGTAAKTLDGVGITNLGLTKWRDSGNIAGLNGASFLNQADFEISGDASLTWDGTGKAPNFLNDRGATFTKLKVTTPPTATTHIGWVYGNDGKVDIKAGALNLEGGGVSYGDFSIALNSRINVAQNYVFDKQTSRFTGAGFAAVINGTTGFDIDVTATNFEFSKGQLEGAKDLSVSEKFLWTGGKMTEAGTTTLVKKGQMTISGTAAKAITQRKLINYGTVNLSSGSVQADDGAKITNNGTFNCVTGTQFTYSSGLPLEFNNAANSQLTGSTTIAGNVTNLGHIVPLNTTALAPIRTANDVNNGGGLINITGNLIQGSGAKIDIRINGTVDPVTKLPLYGQLVIGGNVQLKGNCGMTLTSPSYALKLGDEFKVLRALSIAGDFTTISYPTLPANLMWTAAKVQETGSMSYVLKVASRTPAITSFTPASGVEGAPVVINGVNLSNSNGTLPTVVFNTLKVPAQSATATQIKVLIPAGATTGKLSVITTSGTAVSATNLVILPKILSFSPTTGATGTLVTIKGTTLISAATPKPTIKFNTSAAAATDLVSATANQIIVKAPATATSGKISVTTSDGTATSPLVFTFIPAPVITSIPASGPAGSIITIKGKNFINAQTTKPTVKFGAISAASDTVTAVTSTQFKVTVPAGAVTGKISVSTSGGTATSPTDFVVK